MQEQKDEDRSRPFDLPMGGLLSELLASEGIDAGGFEEIRERLPVNSPAPAAATAAPPANNLGGHDLPAHSPDAGPAIALPGLLSDLLNLAGAAETAGLPPAPAAPPPEHVKPGLTMPPEPPRDAEICLEEEPGTAEPPAFAIPGLLSLLSAEEEPAGEPVCVPGIAPAVAPEDAAPAIGEPPPALPAFDAGSMAASLDELEIDELPELPACDLFEDAPEPVAEVVAAEPGVAEPGMDAARERSGEEPAALPESGADDIAAVEQPLSPPDAPGACPDAGPEAMEPEAGIDPEYSPGHAAAALAEAAGRLVIEAAGRSGESPAAALADLMSAAGGVSSAGLGEEALPPPESCERYVVFHLGDQSYGLHITSVREVEKAGRVTPVPGAPPMIHGLINLHGEILPLIDPRPLLALPAHEGASGGYLVVVRNSGQEGAVAWLVDGLGGMALVDPEQIGRAHV